MEIIVRNKDFIKIKILDITDSLIWTDRYSECGDFQITTKATLDYMYVLQEDFYLETKDSDRVMIIESLELKTDPDDGNQFIVTGRSLESILERRIVWKQTTVSGGIQNAIKQLLMENAIAPEDPDRRIANLVFEESTDPYILGTSVDDQYTGEDLYSVVKDLCESAGLGFKITISENNAFVFKLYSGRDLSKDQSENPIVVFSPKLDNISNTNYFHSKVNYRTIALVAGEGEGNDRVMMQVSLGGNNTDLERREKFTDASDISSTVDGGVLETSQYLTLLAQRGYMDLLANQSVSSFDGEVIPTINYIYGKDFFIGDIVQIENEYGLTGTTRVTELIISEDLSGKTIFPTFKAR